MGNRSISHCVSQGLTSGDHDAIARKVQLADVEGTPVELTVFHNNEIADFEWEVGRWYVLENVVGNEYRGEMQLNPGYDLIVTPLDEPPAAAENGGIEATSAAQSSESDGSDSSTKGDQATGQSSFRGVK